MFFTKDPIATGRHLFKTSDADPVDSVVDGSRPAIYLANKRIKISTTGHVILTQGFNPEQSLNLMCEAMSFPYSDSVLADRKLQIALELYSTFFRETSENARFLTLSMALEVLAPEELKPNYIVQLIEEWMMVVRNRKAAFLSGSADWCAYDALEREIGFRKGVSIRKRIWTLVERTLSSRSDNGANETAKLAVSLYDKRSRLVHDGYLPEHELREATTQMREIVRQILEVRFVELANYSSRRADA